MFVAWPTQEASPLLLIGEATPVQHSFEIKLWEPIENQSNCFVAGLRSCIFECNKTILFIHLFPCRSKYEMKTKG